MDTIAQPQKRRTVSLPLPAWERASHEAIYRHCGIYKVICAALLAFLRLPESERDRLVGTVSDEYPVA